MYNIRKTRSWQNAQSATFIRQKSRRQSKSKAMIGSLESKLDDYLFQPVDPKGKKELCWSIAAEMCCENRTHIRTMGEDKLQYQQLCWLLIRPCLQYWRNVRISSQAIVAFSDTDTSCDCRSFRTSDIVRHFILDGFLAIFKSS